MRHCGNKWVLGTLEFRVRIRVCDSLVPRPRLYSTADQPNKAGGLGKRLGLVLQVGYKQWRDVGLYRHIHGKERLGHGFLL